MVLDDYPIFLMCIAAVCIIGFSTTLIVDKVQKRKSKN